MHSPRTTRGHEVAREAPRSSSRDHGSLVRPDHLHRALAGRLALAAVHYNLRLLTKWAAKNDRYDAGPDLLGFDRNVVGHEPACGTVVHGCYGTEHERSEVGMGRAPTPGWQAAGARIARADLGYMSGAVAEGHLFAACFMPYAALVGYEGDRLLTNTLATDSLLAGTPAAAAARMAAKIFDDKRASIEDIAHTLQGLAAENEQYFRGGTKRTIARVLGIFNPDLSVFVLDGRPLVYGTVLPFQLGLHRLALGWRDEVGPALHETATGLGRVAATFGVRAGQHHANAALDDRLSALDAVSIEFNAAAFAGQASPLDVLLLSLLLNNVAVGARLTVSTCCQACASAAVKHKLVTGYQTALSLQLLAEAELLTAALYGPLVTIAHSPAAHFLRGHRRLRNSLVHLGLGDRSTDIVEADDPIRALIEADLGEPFDEGASRIGQATAALDDALTSWLLAEPDAVLGTLRVPQ